MKQLSQFEKTTMFIRIPAKELGLTATEKNVLVNMSTYLPFIRCSQKTLAANTGYSIPTIKAAIAVLLEKGYLVRTGDYDRENSKAYEYSLGETSLALFEPKFEDEEEEVIDTSWEVAPTATHTVLKYNVYWVSEKSALAARAEAKVHSGSTSGGNNNNGRYNRGKTKG